MVHKPYSEFEGKFIRSSPFDECVTSPNQLRWSPIAIPETPTDFVEGIRTLAGNGDSYMHSGVAIHIYVANRSMERRFFYDADGELLIVPQVGSLLIRTEFGNLEVTPSEFVVIPRGIKFCVNLADREARGYVCENYGAMLRLPELGPIGANGLANSRDFLTPQAAFEDVEGDCQVISKFGGRLWESIFRSFAFGRGGVARQLRSLQVRSESLQLH